MNGHKEVDRILSREEEITPSSGFMASVMEAVRREAAVLPPIAFPWKRVLPWVVVSAVSLIAAVIVSFATVAQALRSEQAQRLSTTVDAWMADWNSLLLKCSHVSASCGIGWIALALVMVLASVVLSFSFASRRA